jgi:isochorismate synthase EntC
MLRDENISVLDIVARLHPTAAVAGSPIAMALPLIDDLENIDRGRYAGAVGWVDAKGDGEFAVAIRCAPLDRQVAHLYAGSGIVTGSDPQQEYEETQWKLETMIEALVPPSFQPSMSMAKPRQYGAEFPGL